MGTGACYSRLTALVGIPGAHEVITRWTMRSPWGCPLTARAMPSHANMSTFLQTESFFLKAIAPTFLKPTFFIADTIIWSLTQVVHDTATLEKWVNKHRTRYTPMFCLDVSIPLQTRNTSPIWPRKLSTSLMRLSASFPSGSKVQINLNLHSNLLYIYKNQIFT